MHEVRLDPDPGIVREGAAISSLSKCSRRDTPSFRDQLATARSPKMGRKLPLQKPSDFVGLDLRNVSIHTQWMPSETTLNAENLARLGAVRLAKLLLELAEGDVATKRRLRMELASHSGGDVGAEIRKRLASIAKSRSFIDWRKVRELASDLDMQRTAIVTHVAPTKPADAFDLLWRMLEMAPKIYERCDDSNGTINAVISMALHDLGAISGQAQLEPSKLAERVFEGVCANEYGQFDGLIAMMAKELGKNGLGLLKARFEEFASKPLIKPNNAERRIIAYSSGGPMYEDDLQAGHHARLVKSALTDIADALGDVDGYIARFSDEDRTNPAVAARIAERLLGVDRAAEAMTVLTGAEAKSQNGGHWPDWLRVKIDVLDALGRTDEAQAERWAVFERTLSSDYLRAYLNRLPDFDDEEAESKALAQAQQYDNFHHALWFMLDWPALDLAAELVLARHDELDGNNYGLLTPAAEALEQHSPLAATLMLRAMIGYTLDRAKSTRYGHAARHLQTCEYLAKRIESFGDHGGHDAFVAGLRLRHGRKSGFWGPDSR